MTTTALSARPAPLADHRAPSQRRSHPFAAAALVLAAFTIPVTGTGRAVAATHAPAHVRVAAVADGLSGVVAAGKNDV